MLEPKFRATRWVHVSTTPDQESGVCHLPTDAKYRIDAGQTARFDEADDTDLIQKPSPIAIGQMSMVCQVSVPTEG